ncbi:cytochrome P450 [Earliella scabrosa]|nr:cytochrome P450 [Earliella scabrosa]
MTQLAMTSNSALPLVGVLSLVAIVCFAMTRRTRKYPPGPPARPLLGNLPKLPLTEAWTELTKYKDIYGDLVFFHGLGNNVLVINSMKIINDLLEKRGNVYSDRPNFTVVGELMGLGQSMPLLPYREEWRMQRKLAHSALSPAAVKKYYTIQEDLAAILAKQLIDSPEDFFDHIRLTASRLILSITYGLSVDTADSEYITHAEETMNMISKATVPGAFLCDFLPFLKYLPSWVPFQQSAQNGKAMIERLVTKPFERVKRDMEKGVAPPSLTQDLLSAESKGEDLHHHIKWSTGSLYGAGGETTYATVITCIMAMALNPEKLKLAQEEIDRVVGTDRLPTIGDRGHLPYINAIIKETMRWHPALPLGLARCTAQDDVYEGFEIPGGTIVVPNVWAIAFEEKGPYDPKSFVPERFLEVDEEDLPVDPTSWAFGFARRLCPGKYLAENSLFILISTILAVFDIAPPRDAELDVKFAAGLVSYPLPFKCSITPRSTSRASQVMYRVGQCAV